MTMTTVSLNVTIDRCFTQHYYGAIAVITSDQNLTYHNRIYSCIINRPTLALGSMWAVQALYLTVPFWIERLSTNGEENNRWWPGFWRNWSIHVPASSPQSKPTTWVPCTLEHKHNKFSLQMDCLVGWLTEWLGGRVLKFILHISIRSNPVYWCLLNCSSLCTRHQLVAASNKTVIKSHNLR